MATAAKTKPARKTAAKGTSAKTAPKGGADKKDTATRVKRERPNVNVYEAVQGGKKIKQVAEDSGISYATAHDLYRRQEVEANPELKIEGSTKAKGRQIVKLRDESRMRWEKLAARAGMTKAEVIKAYADAKGIDVADVETRFPAAPKPVKSKAKKAAPAKGKSKTKAAPVEVDEDEDEDVDLEDVEDDDEVDEDEAEDEADEDEDEDEDEDDEDDEDED